MTSYVIKPPPPVVLPIRNTNKMFPVHRVYCIGRNYAAHAVEMGHDPTKEPPFFFQKNPSNLDTSGSFPYPSQSKDVHYEAEIAVLLKAGGTNISIKAAIATIFGYALCLDMTRRDLQADQKALGRPWEIGKAFEKSAPIGPIHTVEEVGHLSTGEISLKVNGERRQAGDLNQMIWKIPEIISYLSKYFELAGGDVILTGTPSGVGAIRRTDKLEVTAAGLGTLVVNVI